ncbi:ferredoxin:(2Fe-2S)-binding protein [Alcanivorax sp. 521-1]|uniref:Ferredoxin:(2Fe-2S)-binding protein n=1 Tax=Alloalcanivorax profundimaris TaxID=2735259 RepID=A0ABS0AYB4_9GAMM|nr:(2Fe-2S)-binding protein [Alloalcanivorax profundimaris]MAO59996.1 (2Fe-2S)-binding protein [Alcanivorax sp.]MAY09288.1 (2Fe-2S)-binding protein [Alcanivorax sp.]MBF5058461.1 ferredoxin:(2Fe-2S)-binding protein [Alloalcanivorax profundimaris]MBI54835.1 (2Fe-2S)-binding protein [Alcanivorax sp.]|tara:strand:- start:55061 stop:55567 length:507 start_codon:yes stop_codon:yes gene_type:complete
MPATNSDRPEGRELRLTVNGEDRRLDVAPSTPLLYVLRNDLSLNGPKFGCGLGECGACMVLVDGRAARACVLPAAAVEGHQVTTLEGLADGDRLDPVQQAFIDEQGAQCGYCLNGMIMSVRALLNAKPAPSRDELVEALDHNLCRCGTHQEILAAACRAAGLDGEGDA